MRSYVITIKDHEESEKAATRCIESGAEFGLKIEKFYGFTPKDSPLEILKREEIPEKNFSEKFSRIDNCVAAFLSHRALWKKSLEMKDEILILEHDAVILDKIPLFQSYNKLISYGKPSYGSYNTPNKFGVGPLVSKPYLPGAHAYRIKPSGAKEVLEKAKKNAGPTDVFLNKQNFPWIEEYYPWPVEAKDTFTTIQRKAGCVAKHSYGEGYKII